MDKLKGTDIVQIRNFLIVGVVVTAFDFVMLKFLTDGLKLHYLIAAGLAFLISTVLNYLLSMKFVFQGREGRSRREEFIVFAILCGMGLALTELFMWLFVGKLELHYMLAKLFTTFFVTLWSFLSRKIFLERH
ncbi:MAG: GtrA family protein [Clostridiales bacterium]|nr:GtrA family protein [Clostridiales bacterium]